MRQFGEFFLGSLVEEMGYASMLETQEQLKGPLSLAAYTRGQFGGP